MERITWSRDMTCGSGPTCPKAGRHPERGTVLVVGKVVQERALIDQAGVGPDEMLIEVPGEMLPEVK